MHLTRGYCQHSQESKDKMSKTRKGKPKSEEHKAAMRDRTFSEEHKAALRVSKSHKGKPLSDDHRMKLRGERPNSKKEQQKIECPHCSMIGGSSLMKRWHFDKCKQKEGKCQHLIRNPSFHWINSVK